MEVRAMMERVKRRIAELEREVIQDEKREKEAQVRRSLRQQHGDSQVRNGFYTPCCVIFSRLDPDDVRALLHLPYRASRAQTRMMRTTTMPTKHCWLPKNFYQRGRLRMVKMVTLLAMFILRNPPQRLCALPGKRVARGKASSMNG
jgi:hypothetical protein